MFDKHHLKQSWGIISCAKIEKQHKRSLGKRKQSQKTLQVELQRCTALTWVNTNVLLLEKLPI